jgi:hypothetical protein
LYNPTSQGYLHIGKRPPANVAHMNMQSSQIIKVFGHQKQFDEDAFVIEKADHKEVEMLYEFKSKINFIKTNTARVCVALIRLFLIDLIVFICLIVCKKKW